MKIRFFCLVLAVLLTNFSSCSFAADDPRFAEGSAGASMDFGPFFLKDTDVYGNARWRALGPVFESRRALGGDELLALRPFYSYVFNSAENLYRRFFLYPLWMARSKDAEQYWHFVLFFSYHNFNINDPYAKYHLWLFPLYFQGRNSQRVPYLAIFPFAGCIRNFLIFDEIRFALFPLTLFTRVNDVKTLAVVWPIISRTSGGGNERLNIFPLFGYSRLRAESDKHYILWPIWTYARYDRPQSPGYGYIVFPFYGRFKLENQSSVMIVPPLFRFARGSDQNLTYCPWPFFQYSSGKVNKLYFWPLLGARSRGGSKYAFFLWPLGSRYEHTAPFYEHTRVMFFPFLYSTSTRGPFDKPQRKMDQARKTLKIWPLFSYVRDTDAKRFSMLSLFPFRDYDAIERNYGSFWTIYTHSAFKDRREDELLWGLARFRQSESEARFSLFPLISIGREKESGEFNWSLLRGLIAREKAGGERKIRLLYLIKF